MRIAGHDDFIDAAEAFEFFRNAPAHGFVGVDVADHGDALADFKGPTRSAAPPSRVSSMRMVFKGHVGGPSGFRIRPVTLDHVAYERIPIALSHSVSRKGLQPCIPLAKALATGHGISPAIRDNALFSLVRGRNVRDGLPDMLSAAAGMLLNQPAPLAAAMAAPREEASTVSSR